MFVRRLLTSLPTTYHGLRIYRYRKRRDRTAYCCECNTCKTPLSFLERSLTEPPPGPVSNRSRVLNTSLHLTHNTYRAAFCVCKVISSHFFDSSQPLADRRPGKRAPTERRAPTPTRLDAGALYTSFGRDCDHLSSLGPFRLGLHVHMHMDHSRLDQSQDREFHRREGISSCSRMFSTGILLTTACSLQTGIRATSFLWRRTAVLPLTITGILVVHCFYLLMCVPLSAVIDTSHRLCRRHPRPGGGASPHPPKRYADVAFSGREHLAYGIPIAIYSTNAMSTSSTMNQLVLCPNASGELRCISSGATTPSLNRFQWKLRWTV